MATIRKDHVADLVKEYRPKLEKQIGEVKDITPEALIDWATLAIPMVNDVVDLSGLEKKELVLQIIYAILDNTILVNPAIDKVIDTSAKLLLPSIIDGLVYMAKHAPLKVKRCCMSFC
jgi:hypothetical protein